MGAAALLAHDGLGWQLADACRDLRAARGDDACCCLRCPLTRTVVWTPTLAWLGGACLVNSRRCCRTHCRYTGPFFLDMAALVVAYSAGWLPLGFPTAVVLPSTQFCGGEAKDFWADIFDLGRQFEVASLAGFQIARCGARSFRFRSVLDEPMMRKRKGQPPVRSTPARRRRRQPCVVLLHDQ